MRALMTMAGLGLVVAALPAAAADTPQPGRWQLEGRMIAVDMPGVPPQMAQMMLKQPISHSYCLTPEEAKRGAQGLFLDKQSQCKMDKFSLAGGRMTMSMTCAGPEGPMQMTSTGSYSATSYDMTSVMVGRSPAGSMKITSVMKGRYIGKC